MAFIRSIGRWAMTGLVINNIIGSGIFGVPAALTISLIARRPCGNTSTVAMLSFLVADPDLPLDQMSASDYMKMRDREDTACRIDEKWRLAS